ncbi:MAG: MBL fold metallo-hydrolase [Coriobacteriia bacterium]|nr:MBL fold metallo-hydrolase [Coriobacteriia bacterium]
MQLYNSELLSIDKVGCPGGDGYLVATSTKTLLYDSGFAYSAPAMVEELEALLAGRELDYIFLTHSHYDHATGSVWVKERWPNATILGDAHAAYVLERPGARRLIEELNRAAATDAHVYEKITAEQRDSVDYSCLQKLAINEVVSEGSVIDMGSVALEVFAAPGHTRCCLMLWCPEERLLFGCESLGVLVNEVMVAPACLTGYHDSLASIAKAESLQPLHIVVSHRELLSSSAATDYLNSAREWTEKTAQLVWESHAGGTSKEDTVALLKEIFFTEDAREYQPEEAFDLNAKYLVDHLLACKEQQPA